MADDMQTHYASHDEGQRLLRTGHGRLELQRMRELFGRHLPAPPALVADVGGGTGIHAAWLAERGYEVHLVDPVPHHVTTAAGHGTFTAVAGDARQLPFDNGTFDAALLLGPMYHLVRAADRTAALLEAVRVLRPGGVLMAAAISRFMALLDWGAAGDLSDDIAQRLRPVIATGDHDPELGFTHVHFHLPDELRNEVAAAGVTDVQILGIEGPLWTALDAGGATEKLLESALRAARMTETEPSLLGSNPHLLALGKAPSG
ncbi:MAG: class I SAM-dependent methyltransferase [Actinobacteria bacterium]|nr:class I SAM-dependent methyltransferase [Actinomycetota bacterium]MCA1720076.1 class I SAM-dependent methyltransferase [Actinomycetota bacterium]